MYRMGLQVNNKNSLEEGGGSMQSKLLTIKEVAELLQISERSIYNGVRKKAERPFPIKVKRVGKLIRFDPKDVQNYIDKI